MCTKKTDSEREGDSPPNQINDAEMHERDDMRVSTVQVRLHNTVLGEVGPDPQSRMKEETGQNQPTKPSQGKALLALSMGLIQTLPQFAHAPARAGHTPPHT